MSDQLSKIYSDIELRTEIESASPHRLIQLLYDKCLHHIQRAKEHIVNRDIKQKHHAISKASDIINYLQMCLNYEAEEAKDLSTLLSAIYAYVDKCLLKATMKNDPEYLDQAYLTLSTLKKAWDGIGDKV